MHRKWVKIWVVYCIGTEGHGAVSVIPELAQSPLLKLKIHFLETELHAVKAIVTGRKVLECPSQKSLQ